MDHTINWIEIKSSDNAAAEKFFSTVFGWKFQDMMPGYKTFETGAGMTGVSGGFGEGENGPSQPQLVYISCESVDKALADVEANGGKTVMPKMALPNDYGNIAHFSDPGGVTWGLWSKG
jgi:predicted enzyme related to lactoylglutathione lyase